MQIRESGSMASVSEDQTARFFALTKMKTEEFSNEQAEELKSILTQDPSLIAAKLPGSSGWTGLIQACFHENLEVIKILLEAGADVTMTNQNGTTPFMYAKTGSETSGRFDVMEFLLNNTEGKCDINAKDTKKSWTVLDYVEEENQGSEFGLAAWLREKGAKREKEKQVLFICGKTCSGKTFTGDYLATKGWYHVDGDLGNKTENEDTRNKFQALMQATGEAAQGHPVPENQWKDYYEILVAKVKEGQKTHDKVVLSFAVMGIFEGEVEYMKSHFPGIMFVAVQCDENILLDRWCVRMKKWYELANVDTQELWQQPQFAFMHEYAGKDFSWEAYRAWAQACVISNPLTKLKPDPANNCYEVCNDDLANNEAIQGLNKILGIPDGPIDKAAIEKVDEARAATIKSF